MIPVFLGADLGGTNFRAGVRAASPDAAALLDQESVAASGDWDGEDLRRELLLMVERMAARHPGAAWEIRGMGFGLTGDIHPQGTCHSMKRFPRLEGARLADHLHAALGVPVRLLNDGLAAALAELRAGAGRNVRDFVMITLGTGIGGGVVLDGKLLAGAQGRIGKVGHQIIDLDGPVHCHCGLPGCWQTLAGKEGIQARAREMGRRFPDSALGRIAAGEEIDLRRVGELAAEGDGAARDVLEETGRYVGIGLANLVKIFAPECVIVGGGIAENNPLLLEAVRRTLREYAIKPYQDVPVLPAALGKNAGVLGATFLAANE
jgi:glucokinase